MRTCKLLCLCILLLNFILLGHVTVSAESVNGSTPGVRVTWNITVPPDCVALVRVKFRLSVRGDIVSTYNTTNVSETEIIQTGLQCATKYYIRVVVDSEKDKGTWKNRHAEVFVGGTKIASIGLKQLFSGIAIAQVCQSHLE